MYPSKYIDFLVHLLASRDFFECHELLEEQWKEENQENSHWIGLIQFSVGLYHQRRKNTSGALKMFKSSKKYLHKDSITLLSLDFDELISIIDDRISNIENFIDPTISIIDEDLLSLCKERSQGLGFIWGGRSSADEEQMINRHSFRDRSQVILERQKSFEDKLFERGSILFFDGECHLCSRAVQFVLKHEKNEKTYFSPLQSVFTARFFRKHAYSHQTDSLVYLKNNQFYTKSDAVLILAYDLGGWHKLLILFLALPPIIRDTCYDYIAKNRFKWFGKSEYCSFLPSVNKKRFLQ